MKKKGKFPKGNFSSNVLSQMKRCKKTLKIFIFMDIYNLRNNLIFYKSVFLFCENKKYKVKNLLLNFLYKI